MKNNISKIMIIFVALIFAVVGFFYYIYENKKSEEATLAKVEASKDISVKDYTIEVPIEGNTLVYSTEAGELSLFDTLKEMAEAEDSFSFEYQESEYGAFITSINGHTADDTKEFWSISINGEPAMAGVSDLYPVEGDKVSFAIEAFK